MSGQGSAFYKKQNYYCILSNTVANAKLVSELASRN